MPPSPGEAEPPSPGGAKPPSLILGMSSIAEVDPQNSRNVEPSGRAEVDPFIGSKSKLAEDSPDPEAKDGESFWCWVSNRLGLEGADNESSKNSPKRSLSTTKGPKSILKYVISRFVSPPYESSIP